MRVLECSISNHFERLRTLRIPPLRPVIHPFFLQNPNLLDQTRLPPGHPNFAFHPSLLNSWLATSAENVAPMSLNCLFRQRRSRHRRRRRRTVRSVASRGRIAFGSMNDLIDARDLLPIRRDLLPIDAPAPSPERLMWLRSSSQRKAKGSGCVRLLAGLGTQACPSDPRGCWGRTKTDLEASSAT